MSMIFRPATKADVIYLYTVIDKDRLVEWVGRIEWNCAEDYSWRIAEDKEQDWFLMAMGMLHRDDPYPEKYIFCVGGKTMMFRSEETYGQYGIVHLSDDFPLSIDDAIANIKSAWMAAGTNLSGWGEDPMSLAYKKSHMSLIPTYVFDMPNTKQ
jgi:hypothetical protein